MPPRAFVLISFEDAFDSVYEKLIKEPLEEAGYIVERADSRLNQQNILRDIVRGIAEADLIVADLTGLNPNVFYELGLAHALEVPTVLITQSLDEIPFDLRAYRSNEYSTHFVEAPKLRATLKEIAKGRASESIAFGSPVTDFLPADFKRGELPAAGMEEDVTGKATPGVDEGELGWFDALELSQEAGDRFVDAGDRVAEATQAVGSKIGAHTAEFERAATLPDSERMRRISRVNFQVASDLDEYATALESEIPAMEEASARIIDAMDRYLAWLRRRPRDEIEKERESLKESAASLLDSAAETGPILRGFRDTLAGLHGYSRPINTAADRVVKALDRLITLIESVESHSGRIVSVVETLDLESSPTDERE